MKRRQHFAQRRLARKRRMRLAQAMRPQADDRAGSTIVVVIVLMMGLLFLGMLLLTETSQEKENAEYYASGAKNTDEAVLDPEPIFQAGLRQILIGANNNEHQSPFYGGRNSMLPRMLGRDTHPFSGEGINLILWNEDQNGNTILDPGEDVNGNGQLDNAAIAIDQNRDGNPDSLDQSMFAMNNCPAAVGSDRTQIGSMFSFNNMPEPDVGYVYPDHTSSFLSYRGPVRSGGGSIIVELPSYHRPQILRSLIATPNNATENANNWYVNARTRSLVMRPHVEHYALLNNGAIAQSGGNRIYRFVSNTHPEAGMNPFPFTGLREGRYVPGETQLNLDEDPDGDGVKNAVYLDIDQPVYSSPDGTQKFVPLISVTVRDMGALLNLNAVGNAAQVRNADGSTYQPPAPPGLSSFISRSNQGASRSEINPQWLLTADISSAATGDFDQHNWNYGRNPATNVDLANMEWFWLMKGRAEFQSAGAANVVGLLPGINGDAQLLQQLYSGSPPPGTTFPGPGNTQADDNGNQFAGAAYAGNGTVFPPTVNFPAFAQPFDFFGRGTILDGTSTTQRNLVTTGRHKFPAYSSYFGFGSPYPSSLRPSWQNSVLRDERAETRLWASEASAQTSDLTLPPANTATLHMSPGDRNSTGRLTDRVLTLAPYNLVDSNDAAERSRRFTTQSWDLKSYGRPYYATNAAALRNWEFSPSAGGAGGAYQFPPLPAGMITGSDPFRPEVRDLLRLWAGDRATKRLQRRLGINGITDRAPSGLLRVRPLTPHVFGDDGSGTPKLGSAPVSGGSSVLGASRFLIVGPEQIGGGASAYQRQEWLARFDRQRLCRDIYVMLYMFGGARNDNCMSTSNSGYALYSEDQLREMAQFAVNWVDALDPDDTITKFEYDRDLSNGWNLDDDPYTNDGFSPAPTDAYYPEDGGQRGVVFGVEAQKLCISEGLAILAKKVADTDMNPNNDDLDATQWDDTDHRRFAYVELQNVSPNTVSLENGNWQVIIKNANASATIAERRLTIRGSSLAVSAPSSTDLTSRFTIMTAGDTHNKDASSGSRTGAVLPSHFEVNPQNGNSGPLDTHTYTRIAPYNAGDLDLLTVNNPDAVYSVAPAGSGAYSDGQEQTNTSANPAGTTWLSLSGQDSITAGQTIVVQLRRRQHLSRTEPHRHRAASDQAQHDRESVDNPWVLVDEFRMPLSVFDMVDDHAMSGAAQLTTDLQAQLQNVRSAERRQPLNLRSYLHSITGVTPSDSSSYRLNTLGNVNNVSGPLSTPFPVWQPHFDRNFASAAELFAVPLYGPHDLTWLISEDPSSVAAKTAFNPTNPPSTLPAQKQKADYRNTAGNRFLRPDLPTGGVNAGNRWHRMLSLFEVTEPNPADNPWYVTSFGAYNNLGYYRTPGKINLNTLRHPGVLAGILDDRNNGISFSPNGPNFLSGHGRDFWHELLLARDGRDPITGGTLTLPGIPSISRPFRELSYGADNENSIEKTVLRSTPSDGGTPSNRRRLFEAGTFAQHTGRATNTTIDLSTRYRFLSKVMNNTTNRSNVFVIFMQIDFFEAKEVNASTGEKVVRIGAKLPDSPGYRQVYVVDRSKAFDFLQPADLPQVSGGRFTFSLRSDLDFSKLILHKQRIR